MIKSAYSLQGGFYLNVNMPNIHRKLHHPSIEREREREVFAFRVEQEKDY